MCGFVGFLGGASSCGQASYGAILKRMADAIEYRGPNDEGFWCDVDHRIGLGHRRLSIVDLSAAGHQPMQSASGRYVIAFNGEIYNHLLLRKDLEDEKQAPAWRGYSDTETLLSGFDAWGIQNTLERAIGMFAFAVWDKQIHTLILARDRIGEKPLYYGWQGEVFLFGSELKALREHSEFEGKIDRGALSLFLRHSCIPAPYSIYQGIAKLQAGCLLSVSLRNYDPKVSSYWSGSKAAEFGVANSFSGDAEQAIDELEALLKDVVSQQMMADVPLGAFLSGGVDSSLVVALMQAQSSQSVKTFSIGSHDKGYNEAEHAKLVAEHLGTDHTELYVSAEQALAVVPQLPSIYDEPFSDSSQIPTLLVSQLAKQHVTVSLSGDAGDELFCGYNRYHLTEKYWQKLALIPMPLRKMLACGLSEVSPKAWNRLFDVLPLGDGLALIGDKLHKAAGVLTSISVDMLYRGLVSHWPDPASVVIGGEEPPTLLSGNEPALNGLDDVQRMMALDMLTYLSDDILTKVDRAAMAVSLESRIPFLDHRVVEFAWRLPQSMKLCDGQTKWVLRQVLYRYVPRELIERPKMGFGIPLDDWLRGPLRDWAESLLDESRLKREGFFNTTLIHRKWAEHLSGRCNWSYHLWDILMFQGWLAEQRRI